MMELKYASDAGRESIGLVSSTNDVTLQGGGSLGECDDSWRHSVIYIAFRRNKGEGVKNRAICLTSFLDDPRWTTGIAQQEHNFSSLSATTHQKKCSSHFSCKLRKLIIPQLDYNWCLFTSLSHYCLLLQ
jgi:hypothetical protein